MRYISLFSGIEAASAAWKPLGWECAAVSEIDPVCCSVLMHHYPDVPNLGDVVTITQDRIEQLGHIDVVVFGSPCQDLSVAGKRAGLAGGRSGLFFDAMRIVRWSKSRYALWENVPGAFSSNDGRDFASVVGEMAGIRIDVPHDGWQNIGVVAGPAGLVEWAVLDAQWFGVPQRRRRIFALRDSGDWSGRPPVLFNSQSLSGNPPPRRKKREDAATLADDGVIGSLCARDSKTVGNQFVNEGKVFAVPILEAGARTGKSTDGIRAGSGIGDPVDPMFTLQSGKQHGVFSSTGETSHCLNAGGMGRIDYETETLITSFAQNTRDEVRIFGGDGSTVGALAAEPGAKQQCYIAFSCKDHGADAGELAPTLRAMEFDGSHANGGGQVAVAFETRFARNGRGAPDEVVPPLKAQSGQTGKGDAAPCVATGSAVRRLTPLEAARLQGFADNYFLGVLHRGKLLADGPIYRMLGNSFAVPVVRWIGERIQQVDEL